ncbi:MAG: ABC transporter permease [Gemmatimonadaceae bacterium]
MTSDLRYALRQLARTPGFTIVAVLSLALGIGANTTIFSVVNAVLLRPPPFRDPERVVTVHATDARGRGFHSFSWLDYADYRDRTRALAGLAAYRTLALQIEGDETGSSPIGELVSGDFFEVVGTPAALGRTFRAADGDAPVVVISDALWRRRFGADPGVPGRALVVNGQPLTVVGVMPPEFTGPTVGIVFDAYVPARLAALVRARGDLLTDRDAGGFELLGRLAPGATREAARAELEAIAAQIQREHPRPGEGRHVNVLKASFLFQQFRTPVAAFGGFLMAIVGIVLLAACANLANLLLARAAARRREIGVRIALGAGRGRLVRQLLIESLLLALLGAAAALMITLWATDALVGFRAPLPAPVHVDFPIDGRVLAFTLGVAVLTGVAFGLAPALQATRSDVVAALRGDAGLPSRSRLRGALVGTQVALSLVLLVAAGLFLRTLRNAGDADVGFDARRGILADANAGIAGYDEARGRQYFERLLERAGAIPGVRGATLVEVMPLGLSNSETALWSEAACCEREARVRIDFGRAGPGFFATLGVPLRRGRDFTAADREGAPRTIVVNETLARRLWGSADAIGRRVRFAGDSGWVEVVGVARDGKYRSLAEDPRPYAWVPFGQWYEGRITLLVRTDADPAAVLPTLRQAAAEVDPRVPLTDVTTIEAHLRIARLPAQIAGALLGLFGGLALALAAVGVYGVMAFVVARRRREIGIRMALGARAADVVRLVVRQGMRPVLIGSVVGLLLAALLARLVSGLLYGVSPLDPPTFVGISLLLAGVAMLATWVPARRAARVSPVEALRSE